MIHPILTFPIQGRNKLCHPVLLISCHPELDSGSIKFAINTNPSPWSFPRRGKHLGHPTLTLPIQGGEKSCYPTNHITPPFIPPTLGCASVYKFTRLVPRLFILHHPGREFRQSPSRE